MASPGLGPLLALGLPLLPVRWGRAWGQTPDPTVNGNHTITTPGPGSHSSGALPCSWLWGWPCWCGSYGRNGRQRAPTGPAVRSRWVPVHHRPPTSSCRRRSGSSEQWGPLQPLLPRTAPHLTRSSCQRDTSL
ncbi:protein crumbs homolog 3 isoform X2 [Manis pentadactyla]|uniref:protein crumbs homolog 3 isoform X2 n=1 Tax=Manis pentadactyla TaxID=143292 RepID=UPI00255CA962|nr:protein crumbs homolog 3 isoform X2 [Manis pentadactyla]